MAYLSSSKAQYPSFTVGAKPPSSPTLVALRPYFFLMIFMRWWQTSDPALIACVKLCAPVGRIMNSCMARPFPPCFPPLMTLKEGVGSTYCDLLLRLVRDLMCSQRGTLRAAAPALATARETERIALAPSLFLQKPYSLEVPSSCLTIRLSMSVCLTGSQPLSAGEITLITLLTAFETPLPMQSVLIPSLSSSASYLPVDAPDGTAALKTPRSVITSASMVGFPLESKICLALICLIEEACSATLLVRYLNIVLIIIQTTIVTSKHAIQYMTFPSVWSFLVLNVLNVLKQAQRLSVDPGHELPQIAPVQDTDVLYVQFFLAGIDGGQHHHSIEVAFVEHLLHAFLHILIIDLEQEVELVPRSCLGFQLLPPIKCAHIGIFLEEVNGLCPKEGEKVLGLVVVFLFGRLRFLANVCTFHLLLEWLGHGLVNRMRQSTVLLLTFPVFLVGRGGDQEIVDV